MEQVVFEEIEVDRCSNCQGVWFDALEAEKLKKLKGSECIDTGDPGKGKEQNLINKINCPKCTTPMIRMIDHSAPDIHFEACTVCYGLFFDAGEFKEYKQDALLKFFKKLKG